MLCLAYDAAPTLLYSHMLFGGVVGVVVSECGCGSEEVAPVDGRYQGERVGSGRFWCRTQRTKEPVSGR